MILAQATGLYTGTGTLILSLGLAIPAVAAVWIGKKLSVKLPDALLRKLSLSLIFVIGVKLLLPF